MGASLTGSQIGFRVAAQVSALLVAVLIGLIVARGDQIGANLIVFAMFTGSIPAIWQRAGPLQIRIVGLAVVAGVAFAVFAIHVVLTQSLSGTEAGAQTSALSHFALTFVVALVTAYTSRSVINRLRSHRTTADHGAVPPASLNEVRCFRLLLVANAAFLLGAGSVWIYDVNHCCIVVSEDSADFVLWFVWLPPIVLTLLYYAIRWALTGRVRPLWILPRNQ